MDDPAQPPPLPSAYDVTPTSISELTAGQQIEVYPDYNTKTNDQSIQAQRLIIYGK